jgi:hypothetical protein
MTPSDRGREFETKWCKMLNSVEGKGRARPTVASGATFNDHDIRSSMHVCQCKSTTIPRKSVSIPLDEYHSLQECASGQWREDGMGTKIGLFVNELPTGEVLVTLSGDNYIDILKELADMTAAAIEYRDACHSSRSKFQVTRLELENEISRLKAEVDELKIELENAISEIDGG